MENQRINNIVVPALPALEKEIDELTFKIIKLCKTIQDADAYFMLLHEIQSVLSRLLFVENIPLSNRLEDFVRDCERLDDEWLRQGIFNRIQQGIYKYDFMESYWGR